MDKLKQWIALAVVGCLAIVAAGWFLLISPKKAEAEALRTQAAERVTANGVLESQLKVLRTQAKELPKKQADLARISAQIPDNPSLPALIRSVTAASAAAGVELVSITPGAPVAPVAKAPTAKASAAEPPPAAAQTTPTTPAPATPGAAAGTLTTIPLSLNAVGDYYAVAQLMANLETLPRAMRFMDVALAPGLSPTAPKGSTTTVASGKSLAVTLTGSVFMAVNRPAATAVVAPVAAPAK